MSLGQFSPALLLDKSPEIKPIKTHIKASEIEEDAQFAAELKNLFALMSGIRTVTKQEPNLFAKAIFAAFYFKLMENFHEENQNDGLKKERKEFYKIIEFINANITNEITVEKLTAGLYMHRGKLSRIFSKYSGLTVNDYVNNLRISKANELLENGAPVTVAALESGFQSVRTFSDVYKKKMGITPTEYVKKTGG
jgi:AraC-like DNA-binding protein